MNDPDSSDSAPVIKVGLKRLHLDERVFGDDELKSCSLVRVLGPTVMRKVLEHSTGRRFSDGARVFVEGDPGDALFFVLKGEARLSTGGSAGTPADFAVVGKGEVMGEREALGESALRTCSARAVGELEVVELPRALVVQCVGKFPGLAQLLRDTARARQAAGAELTDFLNRW